MRAAADSRAALAAGIAALGLLFSSSPAAEPPSPTKVGTMTDSLENRWILNSTGHLERGSLPVRRGMALTIQVDGQTYSLSPAASKAGKAPTPKPPEIPVELKNDARFVHRFPDKIALQWTRYVRLDSARRGVRFMDVLENTGTEPRALVLRFANEMDVPDSDLFQGAATDQGVILTRDNPALPDETSGVILQFSPELSPAMPMFVFGKSRDSWVEERQLNGYQLKLERSGTLEPGSRAIFIHWIGSKRPQEKGKAEKAFERFITDAHLVEAGVPEAWQADVVNFTPESLSPLPQNPTGLRLVMLDQLCKRLKIQPGSSDLLLLEPGSLIEGDFAAAKVTLTRGSTPVDIPLKNLAALSGGAGKGRQHRLFLRDGSVLAGQVTLDAGKFKSKSVGEVSLNVDSLDHLLLRESSSPSPATAPAAGLVLTAGGELLLIPTLPAAPLRVRTASGSVELPWSEVATIQERPLSDPGFTVALKDGSRLACLPVLQSVVFSITGGTDWAASESLRLFAAQSQDLGPLLAEESEPDSQPTGGWCALAHGSVWAGAPAAGTIEMEAAGGVTQFPSAELVGVRRLPDAPTASGAAPAFDVELAAGLKLRGRFTTPTLRWQQGARVLDLPWSQVTELQAPKAAP